MTQKQTLLVVEDEASIREPLCRYLEREGYRVKPAENAARARAALADGHLDLVISDIMMPGEDGLSLCRHIRSLGDLPVILLTAKTEELDRILGLEVGADDYVSKPFSPRELLARVRAVLRRAGSPPHLAFATSGGKVSFGEWVLDRSSRRLTGEDGLDRPLSSGEFNLLLALIERPKVVLTRDQLLDITQGRDASVFDRSIDNQISRLRRKLEKDPKDPVHIRTVWGGGYVFASDVIKL